MKDTTIKEKKGSPKICEVVRNLGENNTWKGIKDSVLCRVSPGSTEYGNMTK